MSKFSKKSFNPVSDAFSDGRLLGDTRPIGRTQPKQVKPQIEVDEPEVRDFSAAQEYNKNIYNIDEKVESLVIKDNHVLVKLFKYDKETKSEGGILLQDTELYTTAGGQMRAKVKQNVYQKRGIVVKVGCLGDMSDYKEMLIRNTIVHLPTSDLKEFHIDKTLEIPENLGYFLVHVNVIEALEI